MMRPCRHCGLPFQPREWQVRKSDFLCDTCRRAYEASYRSARKLAGNSVQSGRMSRDYHRTYEADYLRREGVKERRAQQMRGYAQVHADRHSARRKLRHEVSMGRITPLPCEVCGTVPTEGHHAAYALPLVVTWLCQAHHQQLHNEAKAKGEQA
ncbi:hypothetical protein [Bordetella petrii]|uniref:hypothetical protein n=1 Tax=Bordetella petrii TaxID=94624 RepID=UPI0012DBEB04|nr:hypothetical protein [Bordetella petrii]